MIISEQIRQCIHVNKQHMHMHKHRCFFVLSAILSIGIIERRRASSMCHVDGLVYTCSSPYFSLIAGLFTTFSPLYFFSAVRHLMLEGEILSSSLGVSLERVEILCE